MFKKGLIIAISILYFASSGFSASVSFEWDPRPESDVKGYTIHQGRQSGVYNKTYNIPCGPNDRTCSQYTVKGLLNDGTYYFVVTAHDGSNNRSDYSNEVNATVDLTPPGIVINFKKVGVSKEFKITVEESD